MIRHSPEKGIHPKIGLRSREEIGMKSNVARVFEQILLA
jgi:hypothetical protein